LTGVCSPQRSQALMAPAPQGNHVLLQLKGPGLFLAATVTKQGGVSGLTYVVLDLDGRNVANVSYAMAEQAGLTHQNPSGLVLLKSPALRTLAVGFPAPLRFQENLQLSVAVSEDGVSQIQANVIHGQA
jgi:hypothetical protein